MSPDDAAADGAGAAEVDVPGALERVAAETPLVEALTNDVTTSEVANVVLQWGGLPVMSGDDRDAAQLAEGASAVLCNTGTADGDDLDRMLAAGEVATDAGRPVVLDPVGAGATPRRTELVERIVESLDLAIVTGNYGEVSALAGNDATVRGVESVGDYAEIAETAIACARRTGAVVVASGEVDVVADDRVAHEVDVGHEMLGRFVGSGCMLGGTLAAFAGARAPEDASAPDGPPESDHVLAAALGATAAFGIAGERAATDGEWAGPASYRTAVVDAVAGLSPADLGATGVEERIEAVAEA